MTSSNQRVVVIDVFGHDVVGTLTGRTMSTPDKDKPELVEVFCDGTNEPIWVAVDQTAPHHYDVSIVIEQEALLSPTDAVLNTIDYLRYPQPGGLHFTVYSRDDKITYAVSATREDGDVDAWSAVVTNATRPNPRTGRPDDVRHDLIPTTEEKA